MNIYTDEGWLDVPHINEVADRNDINFIIKRESVKYI